MYYSKIRKNSHIGYFYDIIKIILLSIINISMKKTQAKFKIKIQKSVTGLGIYAAEDIPKEKKLIEYIGPILTENQANQKGGKYLFKINSRRTIDGSVRYNTARYINHSCRPNCEPIDVSGHIYIYSKRKIKTGEELTYDYGKEYWNEYIKPYGCKCDKCFKK